MTTQNNQLKRHEKLHSWGISLDDASLDFIFGTMEKGVELTKDYFKIYRDTGLFFNCPSRTNKLGYTPLIKAICVPQPFLHGIAELNLSTEQLKDHKKELGIGNLHTFQIPYSTYFLTVGIEETIHHFQDLRLGCVNARLPKTTKMEGYDNIPEIDKLLSEHEVEARTLTDKILRTRGLKPIWTEYDAILKLVFPNKYNKPILL